MVAPTGLSTFERFLNIGVPFALVCIFVIFTWYKFREPFGAFFRWVIGLFSSGSDKAQDTIINKSREIIYDI